MKKKFIVCLIIFLFLLTVQDSWGWSSRIFNDHGKLAIKTEKCVPLPKPHKKRCEKKVDGDLNKALKLGAKEPDLKIEQGGDGETSPKHSYNPEYKSIWDSAIRESMGLSSAQINAGEAREAIKDEQKKSKDLLQALNCDSGMGAYIKIWHQFGRLSHYSADLASPLHAYSVSINNKYHEGDYIDGEWIKGLYDLNKGPLYTPGKHFHWQSELAMGEAIDGISCLWASNISPGVTANNARVKLNEYISPMGNGVGFLAMIKDYEMYTNININFFRGIGPAQVKDGIGVIKYAWLEALSDFTPPSPSDCDKKPPELECASFECEGEGGGGSGGCDDDKPPSGDHPDETFDVSTLSTSQTLEELELLDQAWDRLAVKKGKQSLIWFWMQSYLLEEYYLGNIDEATYESLSENYGLTSATAWELLYNDYVTTPDIAILGRGFALSMSDLIQNEFNEPVRRFTLNDFSPDALEDYPVFVIPSGGLMGLENSIIFKASMEEYIHNGGTIIVFAQQHGYEFSVLPVPQEADGTYKTVTGYGWTEDQSCQFKSSYIDTWHQVLAGQVQSTPNHNLDGYFTDYPTSATVLLRRTANGQPAVIMYEYGQGKVIVANMFSDYAYSHGQASREEIALVRDLITWAKKPDLLPEFNQGETISVSLEVINNTTIDAASVKIFVYTPDRSALLSEQSVSSAIPAGQSATVPASYTTSTSSVLGIYHIDYELYDVNGIIIQPESETDSGRFVVSNPQSNPYKDPDFGFSVNSDKEYYPYGSDAIFTFTIWNNSDSDRIITTKYYMRFHYRMTGDPQYGGDEGNSPLWLTETLLVPANGSASFTHVMHNAQAPRERLYARFFDETDQYIGIASKGFYVVKSLAEVSLQTDKTSYAPGENAILTLDIVNKQNVGYTTAIDVMIIDPDRNIVYSTTMNAELPAQGSYSQNLSFVIPQDSRAGYYTASAIAYDMNGKKMGGDSEIFELPIGIVSVTPVLSPNISSGPQTVSFILNNISSANISSGRLDISFKDPDGIIIYEGYQDFTIAVGQELTLDFPVTVPPIKFGNYSLTYTDSNETRTSQPVTFYIPNSSMVTFNPDKPSYRMRDTTNLTLTLTNTGRFDIDNLSVSVSVPDADYLEVKTVNIVQNQILPLLYEIPIPETVTEGQHAINVTLTLPSGSEAIQGSELTIPGSSLSISHTGPTSQTGGDTINLTIENTGGVDTSYTTEKLTLMDSRGGVIHQGSVSDTIMAGEEKTLVDIQIPFQTANGPALFSTYIKDNKTGKLIILNKLFEITGLSATLQASTDKDVYLKTETISSISNLVNGSYGIEGGNLNVSVIGMRTTGTGEFSLFLPKQYFPFNQPYGIDTDSDGFVYVTDGSFYVIKIDGNGNFITTWGSWGTGDGQFNYPHGLAVDPDGYVYVTDVYNNRVQKFDGDGNFVTKWGTQGSGDGQFSTPYGIAVDLNGYVYVADYQNHRVQKFDSDGNFITKWGTQGSGDTQLNYPSGIAVDLDGYVYVADYLNHRIQKFDSYGNFIMSISNWGSGSLYYPRTIIVDSEGYIYVVDTYGYLQHCIYKFDSTGTFITQWGSKGTGDGQFSSPPEGITVDSDGYIYATDRGNKRVQKFDSIGNFVIKWAAYGNDDGQFYNPKDIAVAPDQSVYIVDTNNYRVQKFDSSGNFITKWGVYGSGDGQFKGPEGIAVDPDGYVYVLDKSNYRVQKFDSSGNFITKWGDYGSGDGQFKSPKDITIDPDGYVYVLDNYNYCVQKFDSNGNFIIKWGTFGTGNGQFYTPGGIAIDPDGYVNVTDYRNPYRFIQKFDSNGNFISKLYLPSSYVGRPDGIAFTLDGSIYITDAVNDCIHQFDSLGAYVATLGELGIDTGKFNEPIGIAVDFIGSVYVCDANNNRIQKLLPAGEGFETIFETAMPVNQTANTVEDYITNIGTLDATGKLYLQAELVNDIGQTITDSEYPFYIIEGDTHLVFETDKKIYKPGQAVSITGEVKNLSAIPATALNLQLTVSEQNIYTDTFDVPAGGSYPFTVTISAGSEGPYILTGTVTQSSSTLAEVTDQYSVESPNVTATVSAPDVVGNEQFAVDVEIKNEGDMDAVVTLQSSVDGQTQTITLQSKETKLIQYAQQITQDTTYTFTFTGDFAQTLTETVAYGLSAAVALNPLALYPEGTVGIPVTITNSGQLDNTLTVDYVLQPSAVSQSKTYYIPNGQTVTDTLYFDLLEGDYQLTASSQMPDSGAQGNFSVGKENSVDMSVSLGTQTDELIPVNVNITNLGYNNVVGNVLCTVINGQGTAVWAGEQTVPQISSGNSETVTINLGTAVLQPDNYTLEVEFIMAGGQQIAVQTLPLSINGATILLTQVPDYQTFDPGAQATFTFHVLNTGNQQGSCELSFKAYDLIDTAQWEFLNPNEEKTITFTVVLPENLEENDYFADYGLKVQGMTEEQGQVRYHISGIALDVNAYLDKQFYTGGEIAHLTIDITEPSTEDRNLFARINYNGYEEEQAFILSGSYTVTFDIPLTEITGEKLFYGIYYEEGISIHLNSLYIYEAGEVMTITTDKQVYDPGETVLISANGTQTGQFTLSAPGGYTETFEFSGTASKNFVLPSLMTAGTYYVNYELAAEGLDTIQGNHPFDVAGISVKVKEASIDKAKYASSDTIALDITIESNEDVPATLKTWVIDPEGNYTETGESNIDLTSSENLVSTFSAPLATSVSGIHRIVYGVYSNDLLLASGSEAFDVGDAVLLGIATDKTYYETNTEPVNVTLNMYGTVDASIELQIDEVTVQTQSVSLNGFETLNISLTTAEPGVHTLKGMLTAGGLISSKETGFAYGSSLPDLATNLNSQWTANSDNTITLSVNVTNQGQTPSDVTTLAFYDGETLIETKPINALVAEESQEVEFIWSVLGQTGEHTLKAEVDPDNTVIEFHEDNNTATISINIPDIHLVTETDQDVYNIRQPVNVTSTVTNLNDTTAFDNLVLTTSVDDPTGNEVYIISNTIGTLLPLESVTQTDIWETTALTIEGMYTITQTVASDSEVLAQKLKNIILEKSTDFTLSMVTDYQAIKQGESATYTAVLEPLDGWNSEITLSIEELPPSVTVIFTPESLIPPGEVSIEITTTDVTTPDTYVLNVNAEGIDLGETVSHTVPVTLDVSGFGFASEPLQVAIQQLESATLTIGLGSLNGYEGTVNMSTAGLPFGAGAFFDGTSAQVPGDVGLTITTSLYVEPGTYPFTVIGDDGLLTHSLDVLLTVIPIDKACLTQWAIIFGDSGEDRLKSAQQTLDGGYVMAGSTYSSGTSSIDGWVIKLNSDKTVAWEKTYGGNGNESLKKILQISDGYIVLGSIESMGDTDVWVLKLDIDGNVIWQKTFGGSGIEEEGDIQQTKDKGFIMANYTSSFGDKNVWILKLSENGDIEGQKIYGGSAYEVASSILQTPDGGYVMVGSTESDGAGVSDFWLIRLDAGGNILWQKTYGGINSDVAYSIRQIIDSQNNLVGFLVTGMTDSFSAGGDNDGWVLKLGAAGEVIWQKTYGGSSNDVARLIRETKEGGYVVAGLTESFGSGSSDIWLLKLNDDGTVAWQKTYGGTGLEQAHDLFETSDYGYVIAGETTSLGWGNSDGVVLKLNKDGAILGCGVMAESSPLVDDTTGRSVVTDTTLASEITSETPSDTQITPQDVQSNVAGVCMFMNCLPVIDQINAPVDPVEVNNEISVNALFTDSDITDVHTATWDWDDGTTTSGIVTEADGSGSVEGSHTYSTAGVYVISLAVTDDKGGVGTDTYRYVVIYDPEGGFVTGGGWINSPEGAYTANPSLTGKANFGFVSKYKHGASVPTGQTEFQFKVADLNFHSDDYDWLVIAGARAQYKGVGTINGLGEYKFMLTGIDADVNENDSHYIDRFRIKIWTEDENGNEEIVYDNGLGADDLDDNATTDIGGGSIKIHKN